MVLKDYNNQIIDREHAKELLSALDLSGHETYRESARRLLADIYGGLPIERRHDVE